MQPHYTIKSFLPGIAWFFLVTILCCLPGSDLPPVEDWLSRIFFDKWVHFGLFCILAALLMWPVLRSGAGNRHKLLPAIAIACSAYGMLIECIRLLFIPGRSFDVFDWLADTAGVALAWLWAKQRLKARKL